MNQHPEKPRAEPPRDEAYGWTFFRQWLKNPVSMAAVSPSSRNLAKKMLHELPHGACRVIELGGGTGVFTKALIERGIGPKDLLVLELNPTLYKHLHDRFTDVKVACADARDLLHVAKDTGYLADGPADGVISGLGMLSIPRTVQKAILEAAFSVLAPNGRFIQFTYGPGNPVAGEVMRELDLSAHRAGFTFWNVPPAAVYVIQRSRSRRLHAVRATR